MNVDDLVAKWEARSATKMSEEAVEEADAKRRRRIFAFTRVHLMHAVLAEAAHRTAVALGLTPSSVSAALVPDEETKRYKPGIRFAEGADVDEEKASKVFGFAFRTVRAEWGADIAFADREAVLAPQFAETLKLETAEALAQRIKTWLRR